MAVAMSATGQDRASGSEVGKRRSSPPSFGLASSRDRVLALGSSERLAAMIIRNRTDADLDGAMDLLARVHNADGYPSTLADVMAFLAPPYEVAAWVAVAAEGVVGHVALHRPPNSATVAGASRMTGLDPERLVVLARLFTSPSRRGHGIGKRLLARAQSEAERRGERAVLDVGKDFPSAAALYESAGWLRVAEDRQTVDGEVFDVWVYVAPLNNG